MADEAAREGPTPGSPCPVCGYLRLTGVARCLHCSHEEWSSAQQAKMAAARRRISLGGLLALYGVLAGCIALGSVFWRLGVLLALLLLPALYRTLRHDAVRKAIGRPLDTGLLLHLFAVSLVVTGVIAFLVYLAFVIPFFLVMALLSLGGLDKLTLSIGGFLGLISSFSALFGLSNRLWPVEDRRDLPD